MNDSPLQAAKDRLSILQLGGMFYPDWRAGKSCKSPFREDRSDSFSVYADGQKWKDFATSEGGDAADFVAMACGLSPEDGAKRLIQLAGVLPPERTNEPRKYARSHEEEEADRERKRATWPDFEYPTVQEIRAIAELRGLTPEGVHLAADRGLLWCADSQEGRAWIVTDARRVNAQARLFSGRVWQRIGGKKAWTLPGSEAAWPIGILESSPFPAIALVEGSPDLLAGLHLVWCADEENEIAVVAMLGASNRIPDDALRHFVGKHVRIFPDADDRGQEAGLRWASQLAGAGADVDGFSFDGFFTSEGNPVKDLNDFCHLDVDAWESNRTLVETAFDIAHECPTLGLPCDGGVTVAETERRTA